MARFLSSGRRTYSGRKPSILFLSTGNTCRSPMAYGIMRDLLAEAGIDCFEVRTAGVMTIPGLLPTQECRQILEKEGINIEGHRSSQLTAETLKRATIILGMTSFHVQMALRMSDNAQGKTFLLKGLTGSDSKNDQIQDPMGCTLEVYKKVFREIRSSCRKLMKKVEVFEILTGDSEMARRIVEGKYLKDEKQEGGAPAPRSRARQQSGERVTPTPPAPKTEKQAAPKDDTDRSGSAAKKPKTKADTTKEKSSEKPPLKPKTSPKSPVKMSSAAPSGAKKASAQSPKSAPSPKKATAKPAGKPVRKKTASAANSAEKSSSDAETKSPAKSQAKPAAKAGAGAVKPAPKTRKPSSKTPSGKSSK